MRCHPRLSYGPNMKYLTHREVILIKKFHRTAIKERELIKTLQKKKTKPQWN